MYTPYSVHCTLYTVHCTLYTITLLNILEHIRTYTIFLTRFTHTQIINKQYKIKQKI